jgi:hypothetical protein
MAGADRIARGGRSSDWVPRNEAAPWARVEILSLLEAGLHGMGSCSRALQHRREPLATSRWPSWVVKRRHSGESMNCGSRPLTAIDERQLRNVLSLPQSGRVCSIMGWRKRATAMASDRT